MKTFNQNFGKHMKREAKKTHVKPKVLVIGPFRTKTRKNKQNRCALSVSGFNNKTKA